MCSSVDTTDANKKSILLCIFNIYQHIYSGAADFETAAFKFGQSMHEMFS